MIKDPPCSPPWPGFRVQPEARFHPAVHSPGSSWHIKTWRLHWKERVAPKMNDYTCLLCVYCTSGQYGTFWNSLICVFSAGCVGRMVIVTSTIWVTLDHSVSICVLLGLPLSRSCEMRLWNQSPPKYCSDSKVGSDMLHFFLEAVLYCPFYQVCIRYHLCGLEIARYPTMHCTSASSLNGGKYFKVGTSKSSQVHMSAQCEWRNKRDCSYINCHYLSVGL